MMANPGEPAQYVRLGAAMRSRLTSHNQAQVAIAEQSGESSHPEFPMSRPRSVIRCSATIFRKEMLGDQMPAPGPQCRDEKDAQERVERRRLGSEASDPERKAEDTPVVVEKILPAMLRLFLALLFRVVHDVGVTTPVVLWHGLDPNRRVAPRVQQRGRR